MWLAARRKMNPGKPAILGRAESRHMYLSEMNIRLKCSMYPGNAGSVNYRQAQLNG